MGESGRGRGSMPLPRPIQVRLKTERVNDMGRARYFLERPSRSAVSEGNISPVPELAFSRMLEEQCYSLICACTAVMATTPTISSAEQPRERSFTGLAMPCRMGP